MFVQRSEFNSVLRIAFYKDYIIIMIIIVVVVIIIIIIIIINYKDILNTLYYSLAVIVVTWAVGGQGADYSFIIGCVVCWSVQS